MEFSEETIIKTLLNTIKEHYPKEHISIVKDYDIYRNMREISVTYFLSVTNVISEEFEELECLLRKIDFIISEEQKDIYKSRNNKYGNVSPCSCGDCNQL